MIARHWPWLALLALSACAHLVTSERAPICDGRERRPANPHGSVLTASPTAGAGSHVTPGEDPTSTLPGGFGSCP